MKKIIKRETYDISIEKDENSLTIFKSNIRQYFTAIQIADLLESGLSKEIIKKKYDTILVDRVQLNLSRIRNLKIQSSSIYIEKNDIDEFTDIIIELKKTVVK